MKAGEYVTLLQSYLIHQSSGSLFKYLILVSFMRLGFSNTLRVCPIFQKLSIMKYVRCFLLCGFLEATCVRAN